MPLGKIGIVLGTAILIGSGMMAKHHLSKISSEKESTLPKEISIADPSPKPISQEKSNVK